MKVSLLVRTVVVSATLLATQGCGADFGKDTAQNEKDMKIAVERFLAESKSALSGNKMQIADRLSAMRSQQLDLKAIESTSKCSSFHSAALSEMANVITAWENVAGLSNDADPGSFLFDLQMLEYKRKQAGLVMITEKEASVLAGTLAKGCGDSSGPAP